MFSVIIISYRNPTYLDLCLKSAYENQTEQNEIIVVLDGFAEESEEVLRKYPKTDVIALTENKGQTYCHNTGVELAHNEWILVVNDDNVFPSKWDEHLKKGLLDKHVLTPNQIEPAPSIFQDFIIKDFGKNPEEFQYNEFLNFESDVSNIDEWNITHSLKKEIYKDSGQTWPLCMQKKWYMILNGIDPAFPSPAGADWDFFLRCELAGLKCVRFMGSHFYHFAGAATKKTPEEADRHRQGEIASMEYFKWKWGAYPTRDVIKNSCLNQKFRGI